MRFWVRRQYFITKYLTQKFVFDEFCWREALFLFHLTCFLARGCRHFHFTVANRPGGWVSKSRYFIGVAKYIMRRSITYSKSFLLGRQPTGTVCD